MIQYLIVCDIGELITYKYIILLNYYLIMFLFYIGDVWIKSTALLENVDNVAHKKQHW